jgi:predicted metal-binding membrane protein
MNDVAIRRLELRPGRRLAAPRPDSRDLLAVIVIAGAWLALIALEATGLAAALHHHALIEAGPPLWIAIPVFLLVWQIMVAAMMLPASLPAMRSVTDAIPRLGRLRAELAFLTGFLAIWVGFGLSAFLGDMVVHRVVDSTPWLASRPWLIEAGVLALAGGYQFLPRKQRELETCRHPRAHVRSAEQTLGGAARFGLAHGIACVGASWALMLLMFGEGFGGTAWMVALTVVMVLETTLASPRRVTIGVGICLVLLSVATLAGTTAF